MHDYMCSGFKRDSSWPSLGTYQFVAQFLLVHIAKAYKSGLFEKAVVRERIPIMLTSTRVSVLTLLAVFIMLTSFSEALADGVLVGMLSKVSGRTITVTTSSGTIKEFRISSGAFITDLATRKKIEVSQLRPGSKLRVSSRGDSFMAVEVLEVPK